VQTEPVWVNHGLIFTFLGSIGTYSSISAGLCTWCYVGFPNFLNTGVSIAVFLSAIASLHYQRCDDYVHLRESSNRSFVFKGCDFETKKYMVIIRCVRNSWLCARLLKARLPLLVISENYQQCSNIKNFLRHKLDKTTFSSFVKPNFDRWRHTCCARIDLHSNSNTQNDCDTLQKIHFVRNRDVKRTRTWERR
jgi:hypothetical protein